jgi:mannose-6-phosphate isomerase
MNPVFKQYLWGGRNLKMLYNKNVPYGDVAESWEVSCHPNGLSTVANGLFAKRTLASVFNDYGSDILGDTIAANEKFPLLLKILDARDKLSIQVHPDDSYAMKYENGESGKTELWHVLCCQPGARLACGFNEDVSLEKFINAIRDSNFENILNYIEVRQGDTFFVPAGTIHTIGAGNIIVEIQQNSDITYRFYDYSRIDIDGKKRDLHINKALDVLSLKCNVGLENVTGNTVIEGKNSRTIFTKYKYFSFEKIVIDERLIETTNNRMEILLFVEGSGKIDIESFSSGDSFVIPAVIQSYKIEGKCTLLKFYV